MSAMVPAIGGVEALFEGRTKDGSTYTFSRPLLFWFALGDRMPQGMYLDDDGKLMSAESRSNFLRYAQPDEAPIIGAVPAGDLYAVYRDTGGALYRMDVAMLALQADGTLQAKEIMSDGDSGNPEDASNFVGYWRPSWGGEPGEWQDRQDDEVEDGRDEQSFGGDSALVGRRGPHGSLLDVQEVRS